MRIWSLCLWLLLISPSIAYTQTDDTSGGQTDATPDDTGTSEEEPDCD